VLDEQALERGWQRRVLGLSRDDKRDLHSADSRRADPGAAISERS